MNKKSYAHLSVEERKTLNLGLVRLDGTGARSAREGLPPKLKRVPLPLSKSLTYDRGKAIAEHERLA